MGNVGLEPEITREFLEKEYRDACKTIAKQREEITELENAVVEQGAILDAVQDALNGVEISDFDESFSIVMQAKDLMEKATKKQAEKPEDTQDDEEPQGDNWKRCRFCGSKYCADSDGDPCLGKAHDLIKELEDTLAGVTMQRDEARKKLCEELAVSWIEGGCVPDVIQDDPEFSWDQDDSKYHAKIANMNGWSYLYEKSDEK
jgi:hypothetical protein